MSNKDQTTIVTAVVLSFISPSWSYVYRFLLTVSMQNQTCNIVTLQHEISTFTYLSKKDLDSSSSEGFFTLTLSSMASPQTCLASGAFGTTLPIESRQNLGHLQSARWTRTVERK